MCTHGAIAQLVHLPSRFLQNIVRTFPERQKEPALILTVVLKEVWARTVHVLSKYVLSEGLDVCTSFQFLESRNHSSPPAASPALRTANSTHSDRATWASFIPGKGVGRKITKQGMRLVGSR